MELTALKTPDRRGEKTEGKKNQKYLERFEFRYLKVGLTLLERAQTENYVGKHLELQK